MRAERLPSITRSGTFGLLRVGKFEYEGFTMLAPIRPWAASPRLARSSGHRAILPMSTEALILVLLVSIAALLGVILRHLTKIRSELGRRLASLEEEISETSERVVTQVEALLAKESTASFHRLGAYLWLRDRLDLRRGLPYTPHWSASPDFLKLIVEHCLEAKPAKILECSSGLTTLVLARACQLTGLGVVVSLENGEEYAARTRDHLARYGLETVADVRHAPLVPVEVSGQEYLWYDTDSLPAGPIDMLVIDGPPGFVRPHSRYPALPLLFDRLAEGCVVFLDDAAREDERAIAEMWEAAYPSIEHEYIETERGCSVIRVSHKPRKGI